MNFSPFRRPALATALLALFALRLWGVAGAETPLAVPKQPQTLESQDGGLPGSLSSCEGQVKCLGGLVLLDGLSEITGVTKLNKYLDLVEISTPSVPSANHVAIWLNAQGASKQALKIEFDDGTIVSLAGN